VGKPVPSLSTGRFPGAQLNSGLGSGKHSRDASFSLEGLNIHGSVPRGSGEPAGLNEQKPLSVPLPY
jgi:hypothetical protein